MEEVSNMHREALSYAGRIAEEALNSQGERDNRLKKEAENRARRETLGVMLDIRNRLKMGSEPARENRQKLGEYQKSGWLHRTIHSKAVIRRMHDIVAALEKGYRLGFDRVDEALRQMGVREIVCEGCTYNPQTMKAVDIEETSNFPDGTVIETFRPGYMMDDQVLHPAHVRVSRAPSPED